MAPDPEDVKDLTSPDDYSASFERGKKFIDWLRFHEGWWSKYLDEPDTAWKFLLTLAYTWETSGVSSFDTDFHSKMPVAFANKLGFFTDRFDTTGLYVFLGSMGVVWGRLDDLDTEGIQEPGKLTANGTIGEGVYTGTLRDNDPKAPFDWANPMPGKQSETLLERVNQCVAAFSSNCSQKGDLVGTNEDQLLYLLVDENENIFFIQSREQWEYWDPAKGN